VYVVIQCLLYVLLLFFFFFFFQAEDGIRDRTVTGVQTCALPIFDVAPPLLELGVLVLQIEVRTFEPALGLREVLGHVVEGIDERSEERRVGKECRWRWWR